MKPENMTDTEPATPPIDTAKRYYIMYRFDDGDWRVVSNYKYPDPMPLSDINASLPEYIQRFGRNNVMVTESHWKPFVEKTIVTIEETP